MLDGTRVKIELREHQTEAVNKMHNGCVLWGGVGTGKTIAALAYAQLRETDKKIVVITTAKKRDSRDWEYEAALLAVAHDGIEVTSWNKIRDYEGYKDKFFIFDEQRLVGAGAWVKSFYKIAKANHWILLSATPGDTWSDYAPMFIANGWYKNITEFRREHAVYSRFTNFPKIERYIGEGKLQKYRKSLLVEMPMVRHTTRHMHYVECEWDSQLLDLVRKKRWHVYEDKPLKNAAELFSVMRKVVSTDSSREKALLESMSTHPKIIVFYNFNYELEILRNLMTQASTNHAQMTQTSNKWGKKSETDATSKMRIFQSEEEERSNEILTPTSLSTQETTFDQDSLLDIESPEISITQTKLQPSLIEAETFGWAEWNGHKHEPIPKTDRWVYLVQYASGSEGWNCTETDAMVFWSLTYSWKQFWQAQGRIDRLNTPFTDLHYYVFMTDSFAERPVIRSLKMKKDFQPR